MKYLFLFLFIFGLLSCGNDASDDGDSPQEEEVSFDLDILMDRSDVVWGFDFLDNDRIIFTERRGTIGILDMSTQTIINVTGVPEVHNVGEGGLLDIRVHPDISNNNLIYFCYTETNGNEGRNAMGMAELQNDELINFRKIFTANDGTTNRNHFGCRIEFDGSGHVYLSLGERGDRLPAQSLASHLGKILRFNLDGSIPTTNPFFNQAGAQPEIYTLGHRNVQGLAFRPGTNQLWASELGPSGGDEVNIITAGDNYGWPFISHGQDSGGHIEATSRPGFNDPQVFWSPSISPSGIAFYEGQLYVAYLNGEQIRRLTLSGTAVTSQEILFENLGWRFRALRVGLDGLLYFSTDDGRFGKLLPIN